MNIIRYASHHSSIHTINAPYQHTVIATTQSINITYQHTPSQSPSSFPLSLPRSLDAASGVLEQCLSRQHDNHHLAGDPATNEYTIAGSIIDYTRNPLSAQITHQLGGVALQRADYGLAMKSFLTALRTRLALYAVSKVVGYILYSLSINTFTTSHIHLSNAPLAIDPCNTPSQYSIFIHHLCSLQ